MRHKWKIIRTPKPWDHRAYALECMRCGLKAYSGQVKDGGLPKCFLVVSKLSEVEKQ